MVRIHELLTFDDEKALVGQLQKLTMDSISMNALNGQDSAWNYASTFNFTCNTILGQRGIRNCPVPRVF